MKNYPKRPINSQNDFEDVSISDIQKNRIFGDKLQNSLREKIRSVRVIKTKPGLMDIVVPLYPEASELLNKWNKASQKEKVTIREMEENKEYLTKLSKEIKDIKEDNQFNKQSKKPKTDIKNGIGFLLLRGEKIPLGLCDSGKFKLTEMLCNESFGKAKTLESVFNTIKRPKDKNKTDNRLYDNHTKPIRIVELLKGLVKEINRDIRSYVRDRELKNFNYTLSLQPELKQTTAKVWMKEKVGRRG